jgi:hypothetical protein
MGISEKFAREALEATANDVNAAADRILGRDVFQIVGPLRSAHEQLVEVESKLEGVEPQGDFLLGLAVAPAELAQLNEALVEAQRMLASIDIAGDPPLQAAQESSLDRCSHLEHRIHALREAVEDTDAAKPKPDLIEAGAGGSPSKRCFTPDSLFKVPGGALVRAGRLAWGSEVLDREGNRVEVLWAREHPCQIEQMVELVTATSRLTATSSHRIVTQSISGEEEVLARTLQPGDWVLCGTVPQQLVEVKHFEEKLSVVELQFEGDASIETYPPPTGGLVTKGQAVITHHTELQKCKVEVDDEEDRSTFCPSSASGLSSAGPELTEDFTATYVRSGRSRTRRAKLRASIQRLPSPGADNF